MDASVNVIEALDVERQASLGGVPPALRPSAVSAPAIPDYLMDTYYWAYLNPRNVRLLDRELVVSVILWGQHRRLRREAFRELRPGQTVLQPACVYGDFAPALARHLGPRGHLEVIKPKRRRGQRAHANALKNKEICNDCHDNLVHREVPPRRACRE